VKTVYVAGAYSSPDILGGFANMRKGILVSLDVLKAGMAPFVPWLDYQFALMADGVTLEMFYNYSMSWLERSDCVLIVEGWENSTGTKKEIERAHALGKPVYFSLSDLIANEMQCRG
jgi:nucleoside 2-deoxyribosyltransferase